jgi:PleD family two-component response regulator
MDFLSRLLAALAESPFVTDNELHVLRFSAGVAQLRQAESVHEQLSRADAILLHAKRSGKSKVLLSP